MGAWYSAISNRYSWQHTTATYSFAQIPCVYVHIFVARHARHTCLCANILGKLAVLYCIVQVDQRLLSLLPFTNFSSAPPANTLMCMQPSPSLIFGPRYAPIYLLHECYQLLTLPVRFQTRLSISSAALLPSFHVLLATLTVRTNARISSMPSYLQCRTSHALPSDYSALPSTTSLLPSAVHVICGVHLTDTQTSSICPA
jgi:hypothetical protein